MARSVVTYALDPETLVRFEIEPNEAFRPAGPSEVAGQIRAAVEPAVLAARAVFEQARRASPDTIKMKFGIKVSGTANWFIAKAATEGNFEVEMTWNRPQDGSNPPG